MRYCLNPKNPHKNVDAPSTRNQEGGLSPTLVAEKDTQPLDQQVTCHLCKYLLEEAVLGDCRVTCWVGSGTFGDVYEAEQLPPLSRRVAIKVMSTEHLADGKGAELFQQEVHSIAALDHPNIMPVLRVGTIPDGRPYLVMKFAAHGSLQKFCNQPPMPLTLSQHVPITPPTQDKRSQNGDMQLSLSTQETIIHNEDLHEAQETPSEQADTPLHPIAATPEPSEQDEHPDDDETQNRKQGVAIEMQETIVSNDTIPVLEAMAVKKEEVVQQDKAKSAPVQHESIMLTPQQLLPYLEGAANALQYAHEHGIIHLDVKPANLLLDAHDRVLLADFGVSTLLDGYTHASLRGYVGTPLYTAPEQWLEQPRAASDQYALAITCYQLLVGRPPFTGNLYTIMHGHIQLPPPPIRDTLPLIPPAVEAVILRGLAKDPAARFKNVQSFALAYRDALAQSASTSTDPQALLDMSPATAKAFDVAEAETRQSLRTDERHSTTGVAGTTLQKEYDIHQAESRVLKRTTSVVERPIVAPLDREFVHGGKLQHRKRPWRIAVIIALIVLLASGSMASAIYLFNPCLLGICPSLSINTRNLLFTNNSTQTIQISNTGNADLTWHITPQGNASWLSLSATLGTLHPRGTTSITLKSSIAQQTIGSHSTFLLVTGQNVAQQSISVEMDVTGANQVNVTISGTDFVFQQGQLQPATQTVTITNQSGQALTWNTTYTENNWLVVTPDQGVLKDGQATKLVVTAQVQSLSPNTYLVTVTFIGKLDNGNRSILNTFDIRLTIEASPSTPTPTQPALQFPVYRAQLAPAINAPTTLRSGHGMVWDDQDNQLLVFGGIDDSGTLLNDLWSYNTVSNTWTQLNTPAPASPGNCGGVPVPRMNAAMVWDSLDQQILLYGGLGSNGRYLNDLWSYSPSANAWTSINCNNAPGARVSSAVWNGHEMLLLGGMSQSGLLSDFWSYAPANGWRKLYAGTPLGQRAYQTMAWDSRDSRLYTFGGLDASGQQQNDCWSYSTATNSWLLINPTTTSNPPERQQGMMVWDSAHNVLLLMGGWKDGQSGPFFGLWAYDPTQNAWKLVTPADSNDYAIIHGRTAAVMVWDATHKHVYIYAGAGTDKTHSSLNDLWIVY